MAKIIAANWKENPTSGEDACALFKAVAKSVSAMSRADGMKKRPYVIICPPYIYLQKICDMNSRGNGMKNNSSDISIGAQNVFYEDAGANTGEVGPAMLKSLGVEYSIIGHSERRRQAGETDEIVNKKMKLALSNGLRIMMCVGERGEIRKKGLAAAEKFVTDQLRKDLDGINPKDLKRVTIAYEPIWAIGSGKSDNPKDASEMAADIKKFLKSRGASFIKVLYGGSVNGGNARDFVQCREIDGALVGGASLKADEFKKILIAARL